MERWGHLTPHLQEPADWRALSSNSCCLTFFLRARSTDTSALGLIRVDFGMAAAIRLGQSQKCRFERAYAAACSLASKWISALLIAAWRVGAVICAPSRSVT